MPTHNLSENSDIFSSAFLIHNVGGPFAIGLSVGYFAKKMLRLTLFLAGAGLVLFFVAEYYGLLSLDDLQLEQAADKASELAKSSGDFLLNRLSRMTSQGISGGAGFLAGLKLG